MTTKKSRFNPEKDLYEQTIRMIDEMNNLIDDEDITVFRIFFCHTITKDKLMNNFIKHVLPWKDKINKKDERFFAENKYLFSELPDDKVVKFTRILINLDKETKNIIWEYFEVFIALAEAHLSC